MIRAAGHSGQTPFMLLGLSDENIRRLQAGSPITVDATELGFPGDVIIMWGHTEDELSLMLRALFDIDTSTTVRDER